MFFLTWGPALLEYCGPRATLIRHCLQHNTHYTVQWVHAFSVITKNITKIRTRASICYIICHKNFANMLPKKWNCSIFLHRDLFLWKKVKKKPKGQTNFLRPTNLRWSQKRPKDQLKFFRPTNLNQGQILKIWKAHLSTLMPIYRVDRVRTIQCSMQLTSERFRHQWHLK